MFDDCVHEFPRDPRCPVRLAQAYEAAGERRKAREAARGALRSTPGTSGGLEMLRRLE